MEQVVFGGLVLLIVLLPIPLGSNRPWAWGFMEMLAFLLLFTWLSVRPDREIAALRAVRWPLGLGIGWLLFTLAQAIPFPASVIQILSPASWQLQSYASTATPSFLSISSDPASTLVEYLKGAMYLTIFFLVIALTWNRKRLKILAWTVVLVGLSEAIFGLFAHFGNWDVLSWDPQAQSIDEVRVRGTFVNRNHFAGHLEMTLSVGLGLLLARLISGRSHPTWRHHLIRAVRFAMSPGLLLIVIISIMLGALFLSSSRAGSLSVFFAFGLVIFFGLLVRGASSGDRRLAPVFLALAVLAAVWLSTGSLATRWLEQDIAQDERVEQWKQSGRMIADYPWFGIGAGNYAHLFPLYRNGVLRPLYYDHVHNDYLETLLEYGVLGMLLLAGMVVGIMRIVLQGYTRRNDIFLRGILFGTLMGSTALLVHGMLDFNFRIPANAAFFWLLLGLGVVAATLTREKSAAAVRE